MIKEVFSDILDHTHGLGFIEMVKIVGDDQSTDIFAIEESRKVVLYGKLQQPSSELTGTIGLSRMSVLSGYLRFPAFQDESAKINIHTTERNGQSVPSEIRFSAGGGHRGVYRFMSPELVEEHVKVPKFMVNEWDVVFSPTAGNLKDLSYFAGILSGYNPTFVAKTNDDGTLMLSIGSDGSDFAQVPFFKNVSGSLTGKWAWSLPETLSILKLGMAAVAAGTPDSCTMSFSEKGALKISMSTNFGSYDYVMPAVAA